MSHLKLSIADAKAQFTRLLHEVEHDQQQFILTKKNKEVAALVSLQDLKLLKTCLKQTWYYVICRLKTQMCSLNLVFELR